MTCCDEFSQILEKLNSESIARPRRWVHLVGDKSTVAHKTSLYGLAPMALGYERTTLVACTYSSAHNAADVAGIDDASNKAKQYSYFPPPAPYYYKEYSSGHD